MNTKVYALKIKNKNDLIQSSSGGAFIAFSDIFLGNKDYILCSIYNYSSQQLEFKIISTTEERNKARGSKYFQSHIGDAFKEAITFLLDNPEKQLLFVGMGCQAEGFRKLCELKGVRNRVTIIDIICTSNPSPKLWKDYIYSIGDVDFINFKDKRNGWAHPTAIAKIGDKEIDLTPWLHIFYGHFADKPACGDCQFCKVDRNTDITIGDFWRIENSIPEFYDEKGNSVVLVHTEKGLQLLEKITNDVDLIESTPETCWQNRLEKPPGKSARRDEFWQDYQKGGIELILKKYTPYTPLWRKVARKVKHLLKI